MKPLKVSMPMALLLMVCGVGVVWLLVFFLWKRRAMRKALQSNNAALFTEIIEMSAFEPPLKAPQFTHLRFKK